MEVIIQFEEIPMPEEWKRLGEMILEGYKGGISRPPGMTWKLQKERR